MELEPASFKGIVPGRSSLAELQSQWGAPKEVASRGEEMIFLYSLAPFDHVEVVVRGERVEAIVIRLNHPFPAQTVAEHLQLNQFEPVLIASERGEVMGQAFPERGVVLTFVPASQPGQATFQTSGLILQPLSAELFLLRAEGRLWRDPEAALIDAEAAIRLDPSLARAQWLRARILAARGEIEKAEEAAKYAVQLHPLEAQFYLTLGEILQRRGKLQEAQQAITRAETLAENRPHIRARIPCVQAELATRQSPADYAQALELYVEAIRRAEPLSGSEFPAIRAAAKETLLEAYLGAADCITFGKWRQKEAALPHWWQRAEEVAKDLVEKEGRSEDLRIQLYSRAIAAAVILRGAVDPTPYAEKLAALAPRVVPDSSQVPSSSWVEARRRREIGRALYDAAVVIQNSGNSEKAVELTRQAAKVIEPLFASADGQSGREPPAGDRFLLGRIYFRIGAAQALGKKDHAAAVEWFDRAVPLLSEAIESSLTPAEQGTLGEMLVSMAVSYWEVGKQDLGYELTKRGVRLVEKAVEGGHLPRTALAAPYSNLGTMERRRGNTAEADRYLQEARQLRATVVR
jgi:tetratricopeptide (TPR) repeat protein